MSELKQSNTDEARKIIWYCQKYMPTNWIEPYNRAIKSLCDALDNRADHSGEASGMVNADEFEEKLCAETQLSIEDMTTVLRVLRECRRVEYETN